MRLISKSKMVLAFTLLIAFFMCGGLFSPASALAALQYVGGASATGTAATYNVSLTALTGGTGSAAAAGDLVIVVTGWASAADGNPGVTTAGYTEVFDLYASDTRDPNLSVNWKIMGGSPDTSVTVSGFNNAANGGATAVHVWRGVDQATPMDVAAVSAVAANNAGVALPDSPAITPVTAGAYVLTVGLGTGPAAPTIFTAPSGYGNAVSAAGAGSTMGAIANIAAIAWTSGPVDPGAWTGATTTSDSWTAATLAIRPAAAVGPPSTITTCDGCHGYASDGMTNTFADGTARNTPAGQFVGDHAKHDYACTICHTDAGIDLAHRNANINMAATISGGTYSRGTSFPQSNSPTTGTCASTTCHSGAVTPQWGVGSTTCSSCHALPPATGAHAKHYTAKTTWTSGTTTNCTVCHPDNTAGHSDVTDSNAIVNGTLVPTGTSPAITCNTTGTGCHNGLATPAWNTTNIACTNCHTVGGASANPNTGLHNMSAAGVQKHDNTLSTGCTACHDSTKPATHADGSFTADASNNTDRFINRTNMTWVDGAANSGTCTGTGLTAASGCHQDNGAWTRLWSTAADSIITTAGDARCAVCHGQFGDWRTGTSHAGTNGGVASTRGSSHNSLTGVANACEDCHSYPTLIANHQNGQVTVNQGSYVVTRDTGSTYCSVCHSNDGLPSAAGTHTFASSALTLQTVAGANDPVGNCAGCHGGGTAGANAENFWPDSSTAHASNDQPGKHVKHMTVIARRLYNEDLTTLLADNGNGTSAAKQKAICEYCHAATTNDSDHTNTYPADVFSTSLGQKAKHLTGAADADAAYSAAADTCSNVDCHNSKLTTDGTYGWYDAGTSVCLMCHTVGDATNNPNSGLHTATAPAVTGTAGQHDDSFNTTAGCTTCHSGLSDLATTQTNTHVNNVFNGATVADLGLNANLNYVQSADNIGTCFGSGNTGLTTCHSGVGDMGTWKRVWNSSVSNDPTGDGDVVECAGCHGGFASDWTFGSVANTTDGSVEHTRNWDGDANTSEVIGNHGGSTDATKCNACHVYGDAEYVFATYHRNNQITMNSQVTYSGTTWNCSNTCHTDNTNHNLEDSGWTTGTLTGPAFTCATCHSGPPRTGAMSVYSGSSHVSRNGGAYNDCTDCHTAHADGTAAGANVVYIPTTYSGGPVPTMNNSYASGTHANRIRLGGTATASATYTNAVNATTEAEMCWGCHDKIGTVSEWGTNNNATTGSLAFDYGSLYTTITGTTTTSNWVASGANYWRSGKGRSAGSSSNPFWYKRGAIQSSHSVNFDSGTATVTTSTNAYGYGFTETLDLVANIRCSYCHDVHGTHNGVSQDVSGGAGTADQPYLRGTWKGSQYPEDGAPQWGMHANWSDAVASKFGMVPRASADPNNSGLNKAIYATQQVGGWWIDQNSNNPTGITSGSTEAQRIAAANASSGLCEQCHGTNKNGIWTTSAIGNLNWTTSNGKETNIWVSGYNGHANAVVGGSGIADAPRGRNILTRISRGTTGINQTAEQNSAGEDMGLVTTTGTSRGYSYRSSTGSGTGYLWFPKTTSTTTDSGSSASTAFRYFSWGTAPGITPSTRTYNIATGTKMLVFQTANTEATHDAQANYHTFTCAKCHNPHASRLPKLMITNCLDTNHNTWEDFRYTAGSTLPTIWANTRHSQWASAQNCHRLDARAMIPSGMTTLLGRGWNRATPWMEFTNPNSSRASNPNP